MITFKFDEIKTTQIVTRFLEKNKGKMNYMKLIKLLYLADREALIKWGRSLTGDTYFSMKHGPVLSRVLDIINSGDDPDNNTYWYQYIEPPSHYEIELKCDVPTPEKLSERELKLIDELFDRFEEFTQWEIRDMCHEILPEWEDVGGTSQLISVEEILRSEKIPEEKIDEITEEVENLNYVKKILEIED